MINLDHDLIICVIQVIALYNIMIMGWSVKKIGHNKYELSKTIDYDDRNFNINKFLETIVQI